MKICVIGSYAKALVMTADRIPLLGETLIGYDYRETYGGKVRTWQFRLPALVLM